MSTRCSNDVLWMLSERMRNSLTKSIPLFVVPHTAKRQERLEIHGKDCQSYLTSTLPHRLTDKISPFCCRVFTGLYRLGYMTPSDALGVRPDISVLAKILTGGMVPMSVTLASSSIFETFSRSEQKADALLHGHSYTAHPIGCEVAKEALYRICLLYTSDAADE